MVALLISLYPALGAIANEAPAAKTATTNAVTTLTVKKMMCTSCADKVKNALMKIPGVEGVEITPKTNKVAVTLKPGAATSEQLIAAVKGVGFTATLDR